MKLSRKLKVSWDIISDTKVYPIVVAAFIFTLKLMIINTPSPTLPPSECTEAKNGFPTGCGFVFDEAYYVPAARKYLAGEAVNNEHPPIAKFMIVLGILIFGDNPLGWRFFSSLMFAVSVATVGYIAQHFTRNKFVYLTAPLFYGFDIMAFNIGQLAMLDSIALGFGLIGTLFFLKEKYRSSALFLGLALSSKTAMLFLIIALLAYKLLHSLTSDRNLLKAFNNFSYVFERTIIIIVAIFIASLAVYDYSLNAFDNPLNHLDYILNYHSRLRYNCSEFNLPFYCIVREVKSGVVKETVVDLPMSWTVPYFSFRPAPYHVVKLSVGEEEWRPVAYWGIYSPIWWTTWVIVVTLAIQLLDLIRIREDAKAEVFLLTWIGVNYGIYFILGYLMSRWVYPFYFIPTIPALAIALPYLLGEKGFPRLVVYALLVTQLIWFFIFFPVKNDIHIAILKLLNLPR
ncbi:MAG TPA: phospholipid carrier-dependent glycosyltransferase [Candidatus Caldiarchaeum subterraneum]|uniref:Phospholipid carrier-dependent glycosyltransferase n=1 Tax=Caldiarchaeum subterraneum TaxID=311458 RepID=A0A832ZXK2_CALS0|nr:phospholipid carrier-dependent glycosyltransferase [Candidatus Caldarchaeum subterraneum]